MDEPNIPWIYVAMVAIIFLRWLFTQFKKAATIRQDMREKRGGRQSPPPIQRQPTPSSGPAEGDAGAPRTLQELFEQKRQEIIEAQRQIERERERELEEERARAVPPPLPARPEFEVEREPVTRPIGGKGVGKLGSTRSIAAVVESRRGRNQISRLLSDSTSLRNAIILKEILDSPKALKE